MLAQEPRAGLAEHLIELANQRGGKDNITAITVSVESSDDDESADVEGKTIMFMSVDSARFRQPVRPGDVLRMHVEVLKHRGDFFKFKGQAMVEGKLVAQAEFAAMVVENR